LLEAESAKESETKARSAKSRRAKRERVEASSPNCSGPGIVVVGVGERIVAKVSDLRLGKEKRGRKRGSLTQERSGREVEDERAQKERELTLGL